MLKIKILAFGLFLVILFAGPAFSQKAELVTTHWANQAIQADGSLSDWPDSLLYNEETMLYYSLANDDKNIYLALKSTERQELIRILAAGISFSANIEGKKKDRPTVIFPVLDRTPGRKTNNKQQPDREEMQAQILSRIKDIKVQGFKEIIDGAISLQNSYGIRALAAFDQDNNFVQEFIIPLRLVGLDLPSDQPVTYQITINGLQAPASRMPQRQDPRQRMGGMYGNQFPRPVQNKQLSSKDFYIKSLLAKKE